MSAIEERNRRERDQCRRPVQRAQLYSSLPTRVKARHAKNTLRCLKAPEAVRPIRGRIWHDAAEQARAKLSVWQCAAGGLVPRVAPSTKAGAESGSASASSLLLAKPAPAGRLPPGSIDGRLVRLSRGR